MKPGESLEKKSNFSLHGFSRYSTPNMALQKIILTSFFLFFFCFSSSSRSRAMRSPRHNSSKTLSNRNEISQTCSGVNVVVPNIFLGSFGSGASELGDLKVEEFCHAISGRISNYLNFLMNYILLNRNGSTRTRNVILSWLEWQARMVDPSCKIILL